MATIEDLLDGPPVVEDVNEAFYINPITRQIEIPEAELILGAVHDDRGECKFFRMPKVVGNNVQVSACSLRVYYTNANGDSDYFLVNNCVDKDDCVEFCWELSKKVTAVAGRVKFSICVCRVENDEVQKEWNTTDTYGTVLSSINGAEHEDLLPTPDVIGRVEHMATEAKNSATQAALSAKTAGDAKYDASVHAQQAAGASNIATEAARNASNAASAAALSANNAKADADRAAGVVSAVAELPERVDTVDQKVETLRGVVSKLHSNIQETVKGEVITVSDASDLPLAGLKLYGKTVQNDIPTPAAPIPLKSVGDGGSVTVTVSNNNILKYPYYRQLVNGDTHTTYGGGVTYTVNTDGSITFTGTNSNTNPVDGGYLLTINKDTYKTAFLWLPVGTYTFSTGVEHSADNSWFVYLDMYSGTIEGGAKAVKGGNVTFNVTEAGLIYIAFRVNKGGSVSNVTVYPQLEVGSTATAYRKPTEIPDIYISTPNGLPMYGIKVSSGGNHTDSNGQQWMCDEVDFEKGQYIQRIGIADKNASWSYYDNGSNTFAYTTPSRLGFSYSSFNDTPNRTEVLNLKCNCLSATNVGATLPAGTFTIRDYLYVKVEGLKTTEEYIAWMEANDFKLLYILENEKVSQLSEEELAAYASMHTNYPNTTVYNDSGAEMEVKYAADTKEYIDKKFRELATAVVNNA